MSCAQSSLTTSASSESGLPRLYLPTTVAPYADAHELVRDEALHLLDFAARGAVRVCQIKCGHAQGL
jgi:hypothetical protein